MYDIEHDRMLFPPRLDCDQSQIQRPPPRGNVLITSVLQNLVMCTRYISPEVREIEALWHVGPRNQVNWVRELHPLRPGPFVRRASDGLNDLVLGQWGMIPRDNETRIPMSRPRGPSDKPKRISTVNARSESVASRPTFSEAWKRGQRCIIPASSFDEPNWETGENVWWRFCREDDQPWGIAGLWSTWIDPLTGEVVPNYTMLTMNADAHPLMNRMHKPVIDPKTKKPLPPEKQDKRSLVLLESSDFDRWLDGTVEEAKTLIRLTPVSIFKAGPIAAPPVPVRPAGKQKDAADGESLQLSFE